MPDPTAVTIGNFDGVHVGHAALVRACRDAAGDTGRVVVIAFDPSPQSVLRRQPPDPPLTTFDERARLLRLAGADEVYRLEPTPQLLGLSPHAFLEQLQDQFSPTSIVEGPDFHFGRNRRGDVALLQAVGEVSGFDVRIVPGVDVDLLDQTLVRASSSITRWLLSHGRVADAARVLGRPYRLHGIVIPGDRRGRTIHIPTANIQPANLPPGNGVYAAHAILPDGRTCHAALNVGNRPTVDGTRRAIEAHLIDITPPDQWSPIPGLDEYGWTVSLDLVAWLRDEMRFDSLDALVGQIRRDIARVRDTLDLLERAAVEQ